MITVFDSDAEVCLNCKHKWKSECTLFDELKITVVVSCLKKTTKYGMC